MSYDLQRFWHDQAAWSESVFGTSAERGPEGPLRHLIKEAGEALGQPGDLSEYIDCQFLVVDACRRAGFTYEQFMEALEAKLAVNKGRRWGRPSPDQPVEHVRDEETPVTGRVYHCGCLAVPSDKIKAFCPTHNQPLVTRPEKAL